MSSLYRGLLSIQEPKNSYSWCSWWCTWWSSWGTALWSSSLSWIPAFTPLCTSFSVTFPFLTFCTHPPLSLNNDTLSIREKKISLTRCVVQMSVSFTMASTVCTSSSDGIWPLRSHLHPFEISYHHEQGTLYSDGSSLMGIGLSQLIDTNNSCNFDFALLWEKVINHFVCQEILAFLNGCTDSFLEWLLLMLGNVIFLFVPLLLISISYIFILSTVLESIQLEEEKRLSHAQPTLQWWLCFMGQSSLHI